MAHLNCVILSTNLQPALVFSGHWKCPVRAGRGAVVHRRPQGHRHELARSRAVRLRAARPSRGGSQLICRDPLARRTADTSEADLPDVVRGQSSAGGVDDGQRLLRRGQSSNQPLSPVETATQTKTRPLPSTFAALSMHAVEMLRLVATVTTNQRIADEPFISWAPCARIWSQNPRSAGGSSSALRNSTRRARWPG